MNLIAFIKELRRREVFRTAGMYVGVSWILFEVASLVLPVFDAPDWLLRTIIIIAFAGFPVTLALAWIYDVTERGIVIQPDATDTVILPIGKHRSDYVVMAVLVLALVLSLGLNAFRDDSAGEATADAGISLIVSKFENRSGDRVFDNALPYALRSNFENARVVFACIDLPSVPCSAELRVSGSIARDTDNYELTLVAARESDGTEFATVHGSTSGREGVYEALGQLSGKMLASLGADSYNGMAPVYFVPSAVDAADRYARAEMLRLDGQNESAQLLFEKALQVDPGLVHARIGLAKNLAALGRADEARLAWTDANSNASGLNVRERRHLLAQYQLFVKQNPRAASKTLVALLIDFPADNDARLQLAETCFQSLAFSCAHREALASADGQYDDNNRARAAVFALYAGDYETALSDSMRVLQDDADNVRARLTVAAHAILTGDVARAEAEYRKIEALGREPISVAGLRDVSYYSGATDGTAITEILLDDQASVRVGSVGAGQLLAVISEARRLVEHQDIVAAIQTLSTAIDTDDHWLLRFERGKAYLVGGYFAEALDEFSTCQARLGEASALFLDDRPTLRYAGALPYWLGRAQESLGMHTAAGRNYGVFIGRRPDDPLADDARQRMQ